MNLLFANNLKAFLDKDGEIDHGLISWPLDLKVLEKDLSPEEVDGLVNDILLISIHLWCRSLELSLDRAQSNSADCLDALISAELGVVGHEGRLGRELLQ